MFLGNQNKTMIDIKFENMIKISPNYKLTSFILLDDVKGWSDGYMADLTNINLDVMKLKALTKKDKLDKYFIEKGHRPKIELIIKQIKNLKGEPITDIKWRLLDNTVLLKSKKHKAKCNPSFIKYFVNAYKPLGTISLSLYGKLKPIEVKIGEERVGLIMPITNY